MTRSSSGPRSGFGRHGVNGPDDRHDWGSSAERRGSRLGRFFAHGDLHLLVLSLIAEKPRHGYEVIKSIEAQVNGAYTPSPGTVYPALTLLEEQGYVRAEASEGSRRLFAITEAGATYLTANGAQVEQMLARMAEVRTRRPDMPAPVMRAMENLKLAMRLRLERGALSPTEAQAIAEALDQAAIAIERS